MRGRTLKLLAMSFLALVAVSTLHVFGSDRPIAEADHNEFPNEQLCEISLAFFGGICPDEVHGAFHDPGDWVNSDEIGPNCFFPSDPFAPFLEPGHALIAHGSGVNTPNGNLLVKCEFDVPEEIIVQEILSAQVLPKEGKICFGPLGPTEKTQQMLLPNGTIKMTCHFRYGKN